MLKDLSNAELIELYKKQAEFLNYLEKEIESMEKKRDNNG